MSAFLLPELWSPPNTSRFTRRLTDEELLQLIALDVGWHGSLSLVADKIRLRYEDGHGLRVYFDREPRGFAYGETEEIARANLTAALVNDLQATFHACLGLAGPPGGMP